MPLTLVLHANWSKGSLNIWAESLARFRAHATHVSSGASSGTDAEPAPTPTESGDARQQTPQNDQRLAHDKGHAAVVAESSAVAHPFDAEPSHLRELIERIDPDVASGATPGTITLRLPANGRSVLASDRLEGVAGIEDEQVATHLDDTCVRTIRLAPLNAWQLLRWLDEDACVPDDLDPGPSLRFFIELAQLLSTMLLDQRYVLSMYQHPEGLLEGAWIPWIEDQEATWIDSLIERMPPAARCVRDPFEHHPWLIVDEALRLMTDAVVRSILVTRDFIEAVEGRKDDNDNHPWLIRSLVQPSPEIRLSTGRSAELFRDVRRWLSRLTVGEVERPYRFVIRVNEPLVTTATMDAPDDVEWTLTLHLQERNAPNGALLDVEELWNEDRTAQVPGRIEELQEFALRELSRAGSIFEPFKQALAESIPQPVELSTRDVHTFLKEAAPVLEESGFRVRFPDWWGNPTGRLGARLLLDPIEDADGERGHAGDQLSQRSAARALGLRTLVRYRWDLSIGDEGLSFEEFERIARSNAPLVFVNGQWIEVRTEDIEAARALIEQGSEGEMTVLEAMQHAYGVRGGRKGLTVTGLHASGWVEELLGASAGGVRLAMIDEPEGLSGTLRPYQVSGASWLAYLDSFGLGACLADDMGLGKTIQLIALLLHERENAPDDARVRPTLVIAPMSVISNWQRELARFAPSLRVHVHHGPDRPVGADFESTATNADVSLTTYGLVNRDVDVLKRVHWGRVVLDEAQYVKNTPTKQAQAIRALTSDRRVALTGTPVENRLSELWSIMDFLNPGYLGQGAEFRRRFAIPIEKHRDQERAEALQRLIRPFILRRLKTDPDVVPDLPSLVKTKEYATLTQEQSRLYQEVVNGMLEQVDDASGMHRRGLVLAGIVKLKQICNHPANLADGGGTEAQGIDADVALSRRSGKVRSLMPLLEEVVAAGDQALVFTQYRRMGHLLSRMVQHDLNVPIQFMHGGTPRTKRQEMIDRFQDESTYTPIFVLSLRAGGVGLNLTGANHVIHFDRWWNPAVESQATDRAFRIGQTRTVHVHTLICSGTLEEHIDQLLEQKRDLAERIVGSGDAWLTELSTNQLRDLLMLRDATIDEDEEGDA